MTSSCPWLTRILTHAPDRLPGWYELPRRFAITPSRPCSRTARISSAAEAGIVSEKRIGSANRDITLVCKSLRRSSRGFAPEIFAGKNQEVEDIKHKAVLASGVVLQQI